ncbi:MAG: bifunctional adenosylcobinamide kinase/adenosylcobinamide-phosphate guanylyltransferase [Oscillospiraceae bacterium]|nr:bifunctional adenosylcobinamide kinase/adenosylcobinamide-phosphate guanylyltransferase [Oscillospiraceae bacterium]
MARTYLITGGANSGKARWAISYFERCDNVLYVTSNEDMDDDTKKRMEYSTEHNYVNWTAIRHDGKPADALDEEHKFVIYDGLPEYVLSLLGISSDDDIVPDEKIEEVTKQAIADVTAMLEKADENDINLILITLEAGFSVSPFASGQKAFRDCLSSVNQRIANIADEVYLSVSGIQMQIK